MTDAAADGSISDPRPRLALLMGDCTGIGPELVGRLLERFGAKIRGYKDSSGEWANTAEIRRRFPQLETFVGSEALLLANLNAGGAGCISASVNVQPSPRGNAHR